ncbi:MAG: ECF-type sigma factor [Verrucomicrobiota bacterium]
MSDVILFLTILSQSGFQAAKRLRGFIFAELRRFVVSEMSRNGSNQTFQLMAIFHGVWLRLAGSQKSKFEDRVNFFPAAKSMPCILNRINRKK